MKRPSPSLETPNQRVRRVLRELDLSQPGWWWQTEQVAGAAALRLLIAEPALLMEHAQGKVEREYSRELGVRWRTPQPKEKAKP